MLLIALVAHNKFPYINFKIVDHSIPNELDLFFHHFVNNSIRSPEWYTILLHNICYLDCKIYCLICFDKNTKHRRAFSFRDMHKAFNVKIRVTCIISVNKMRCDKWFSLLLPFHLDSTNSYLTISIQIEEKKASFILGLIQRYDAWTSVSSTFHSVFPVTSNPINVI